MTHVYVKKSENDRFYVALCIDDNLMVGNVKAIDDIITVLKENGLVLKIMEGLQDYYSCKIIFNGQKEGLGRSAPSYQNMAKNLVVMLKIFAVTKLQVCLNF